MGPGYDDPVQAVTASSRSERHQKERESSGSLSTDRVAAAFRLSVQRKRIYPSRHLSPFSPPVLCPTSKREARSEKREARDAAAAAAAA